MPSYLLDDGYPDDWFVPPSTAASAPPPALGSQTNPNNPSSNDALSGPFNPFSPYWDSLPADRLYKVAWAPPIFPDAYGRFQVRPPPPSPPDWTVPTGGLFDNLPRLLAERAAAEPGGIFGNNAWRLAQAAGTRPRGVFAQPANPQTAVSLQADASPVHPSYAPSSRSFMSPNPADYRRAPPASQLAQAIILGLPPSIFLTEPPAEIAPPEGLTPLEDLPSGSAGGPGAEKPFPRSLNDEPDGTPCAYCGRPTTRQRGPDQYNGDHIIPRIQGGNNSPENHVPSCRTCNLRKGGRSPVQWYSGVNSA